MRKLLSLCLVCLLILCGVQFAAAQEGADITVDASASLGTISQYIFGANMGHHSLVPAALMEQAQALNLSVLRFGGGDSDQQDLRTSTLDIFVLQARLLGAEPLVTVRLLDGTPEAAAALVRYANIEKGYNIRYWSIGNEPNLFVSLLGAERFTVNDLIEQWRAISDAMLAVDPTILFIGPDITQYVPVSIEGDQITFNTRSGVPRDAEGNDWLIPFLEANGDRLAYVSIHRYPWPGEGSNNPATIPGLAQNPPEWDVVIPNVRQIIRQAAGRDIPLAVTEFNSNSSQSAGGEASLDSHFNALWVADVLGRMINNRLEMAVYWDIQGSPSRAWGLLAQREVRPPYYTYLMYSRFGTELLSAESNDPHITVYAAQREDGAVTVMVINLGDEPFTRTLSVSGFEAAGEAEVWRFDRETNAEQIEPLAYSDGVSITVPGQSLTLYVIPPA